MMGITIAVMTLIHTVFHVLRWSERGEADMLVKTSVGVTGAIAALTLIPIVGLMAMPARFKKKIRWETRKAAHMLCIVFGVVLCFHTLRLAIFMGVIMGLYTIEKLIAHCILTHKIQSSHFRRLPSGVQLTFKNPPGWRVDQTGYVNIAVPWISRYEWHPFSVYPHPIREGYSAVCITAAGDWTHQLHTLIEKPTTRPVWIQGPLASPYHTAMEFDKLILVASGIGITPALSCLHQYRESRHVALLWMCRDPALIQFFLEICQFEDTIILIYYTGKAKLSRPATARSNVCIIAGESPFASI